MKKTIKVESNDLISIEIDGDVYVVTFEDLKTLADLHKATLKSEPSSDRRQLWAWLSSGVSENNVRDGAIVGLDVPTYEYTLQKAILDMLISHVHQGGFNVFTRFCGRCYVLHYLGDTAGYDWLEMGTAEQKERARFESHQDAKNASKTVAAIEALKLRIIEAEREELTQA